MIDGQSQEVRPKQVSGKNGHISAGIGFIISLIIPTIIYYYGNLHDVINSISAMNTFVASLSATFLGYCMVQRVVVFPGISHLSHALPSYLISYGLVVVFFLFSRLPYSGIILSANFGLAVIVQILSSIFSATVVGANIYVIPGGRVDQLSHLRGIHFTELNDLTIPDAEDAMLVADLHFNHGDECERIIAAAALRGIPVYHYKQVIESLTGRVRIEHMSENIFGSLIPNTNYAYVKRVTDVVATIILIPFLVLPLIVVAILIRLESPGPVFFRQTRIGYRGVPFDVVKFRTMRMAVPGEQVDAREAAMTKAGDSRITRVGHYLRMSRLDELPQLVNVLRGEMSWIGPRPEAVALSEWYQGELPFYSYRHIVRPGITGWAQVNQGHVTSIDDINQKLQYDFFYIKNFSYWIDIIIVFKTVLVMFNAHGAK